MDGTNIAAASFIVTTAVLLIGGGIAYARQETKTQNMITLAQKEIDDKIDATIRAFGETATAIRQKITEVELFMRDNYIKRDSFYGGLNALADNLKILSNTLDGRLIRMENKIDEGRKWQRESGGT